MANQLLKDAVHANALTSKQGMLERLFTLAFSGLVYPQIWAVSYTHLTLPTIYSV